MDKELRSCDAYQNLESTVRNMITSLRAVAELQNPAIRERHWEQLMNATKVSGDECLKDISSAVLILNLTGLIDNLCPHF
jgi:dynein heavy chain, axonemal